MRGRSPALALAVLAAACSRPPALEPRGDDPPPAPGASAEVDALRALGYLAVAEAEADPSLVGAIVHDPTAVAPGYNLYATRVRCAATLIDNQGVEWRRWQVPDCRGWDHVELLADGDLIAAVIERPRPGLRTGAPARSLVRLTWDGAVRWRVPLAAHHDAIGLPDETLVALVNRERLFPPLNARVPVLDDELALLEADGRVRETGSLGELLLANQLGFRLQRVRPESRARRATIDLLHANALELLAAPPSGQEAPVYAAGQLLVTLRHQDSLVVVDPRARRLVWAWGQGILSGPHDGTQLADGRFLVFDNGLGRGRSRVLELDPVRREIVWEYPGAGGLAFFTRSHGAAQRLANGNTLIVSSDEAHAFEVTRDGRLVWEFWGPLAEGQTRRATLNRMRRYPPALIERWLGDGGGGPPAQITR